MSICHHFVRHTSSTAVKPGRTYPNITSASLQVIKSVEGKPEYVLIPVAVYKALREEIEDEIAGLEAAAQKSDGYVPFAVEDSVSNPVSLARIQANVTQEQLAARMGVSQAYLSKIENQAKVTAKLLAKVDAALAKKKKR